METLLIAILASLVVLVDWVPRARERLRRRRVSRGGAFGAVLDSSGRVLGIYLDPWGHPWRAARVQPGASAWCADPEAWACEGFGETALDAVDAANRLRRRHLQLLGLRDDPGHDDLSLASSWLVP